MPLTTSPVTVGRFTLLPNGDIEGPAEYLNSEWFDKCLAKIQAGQSVVFNYPSGAPAGVALLVAIQTDYAAWRGARSLMAGLR